MILARLLCMTLSLLFDYLLAGEMISFAELFSTFLIIFKTIDLLI